MAHRDRPELGLTSEDREGGHLVVLGKLFIARRGLEFPTVLVSFPFGHPP